MLEPGTQKLFLEVQSVSQSFKSIIYSHSREQNIEADALVNKVLDREERR